MEIGYRVKWAGRFTILALVLSGCSQSFEAADATNAEAVAQGKILYAQNCAACHGQNLEGQPHWKSIKADGTLPAPPHNDEGHTWHHADTLLFDYTKNGGASIAPEGFKSAMPAFSPPMSDSDIWATLSFIKSQWSPKAQARQARMNPKP